MTSQFYAAMNSKDFLLLREMNNMSVKHNSHRLGELAFPTRLSNYEILKHNLKRNKCGHFLIGLFTIMILKPGICELDFRNRINLKTLL